MNTRALLCLFTLYFFFLYNPVTAQPEDFKLISQQFAEAYEALNLPEFGLDYVENLSNIQSKEEILKQEETFNELQSELSKISTNDLSASERLDYDIMIYTIAINRDRINLEKKWNEEKLDSIPTTGLAALPDGKKWYDYFLRKWVDLKVSPEMMYDFGLTEIERVKGKMKNIQEISGMDSLSFRNHLKKPEFFFNSPDEILTAYENKKKEVANKITNLFPELNIIPDVAIKEYKETPLIEVPGFYRPNENTLYFKYFDRPYSKRQIGWLYTHEGLPGHHYQIKYAEKLPLSDLQKLVSSSCYREGWAAYIEEIGYEIGAYKDSYEEYGKWEWDLIRSVRVVLDVGLNYHGWNDEEALEFWQQHIQEQDDIAAREIKRMKRWPAQVITYKYGADMLISLRKQFEERADFSVKQFHEQVLQYGDIPMYLLERHISGPKELHNIPYTEAKRPVDNPNQRLNLVLPQTKKKVPLLIWIGGGAWALVSRAGQMNIARNFAKEGIAVASVGHRLSPDYRDTTAVFDIQHPAHVEDIATATKWLIDHADEYSYDKEQIFVGGFSSGAHLSATLALDDRFLKAHGLTKENIKGIIPVGGTYDISKYHQVFVNGDEPHLAKSHVQAVFGDTEAHFKAASPTTYLDNLSVPILLFSDTMTFNYTKIFEDAVKERNFQAFDVYHPDLSHGELWMSLSGAPASENKDLIVSFIRRHSKLEN